MHKVLDDSLLAQLRHEPEAWLMLDSLRIVQWCNPAARRQLDGVAVEGEQLQVSPCPVGVWQGVPLADALLAFRAGGELYGLLPVFSLGDCRVCRLLSLQQSLYLEQARLQREQYLQILSSLAASGEKDRLHRLDLALKASAEALGMDIGFVARRSGNQLEIIACHAPGTMMRGDIVPRDISYCEHALSAGELLCLPDVLLSPLADSACYREFRFRAYIGLPLVIDDEVFGTLAFCSALPHSPFSLADTEFVRHLARWVAVVVERKLAADAMAHSQQAMSEQLGWLRLAGQVARLGHWSYAPHVGQVSLSQEACLLLEIVPRPTLPLVEVERRMVVPDRQRWRDALRQSLRQRTPLSLEVRLRRDGAIGWLSLRAQVVERDGLPLLFGVLMDVSEVKESQRLIQYQASHDALTGCVNRSLLFDRLEQEIRRSQRLRQQFALLFIDLDYFKQVNDCYGHAAGDRVLVAVAERLMALLRRSDTVARVGGDEFVVLVPAIADEQVLAALVRKIVHAIEMPVRDGDIDCRVSASVGVALYPDDGEDPESLLRHADHRMYIDKSGGGR